jgi:serine protease
MTTSPKQSRSRRSVQLSKKQLLAALITSSLLGGSAIAADFASRNEVIEKAPNPNIQQPQAKYLASPDAKKSIPGQYIVVFKDGQRLSQNARTQFVSDKAAQFSVDMGAKILHQYDASLAGVAIEVDAEYLGKLLADPQVAYVEEDTVQSLIAVQNNPPSWGIDRIDERTLPLDNRYESELTGAGVNAYIIDTGLDLDHPNFTGRASLGVDVINDGRNGNDCNGHGTHVGGTTGSESFGVAKDANVFAVRVFGCGNTTSTSNILAGMDWVIDNAVRPAVANMSLGGPASATQDALVQDMVNAGIVTVVAAGNSNADACGFSPARAPNAITVGSTTINDARSGFSNFGSCVDLFGPGSAITSTWLNGGTNTISGTSMASPHVAGVAALELQRNPNATVAQVTNSIIANATTGQISDTRGTVNRLLFMGHLNGGNPPPPPPPGGGSCSFEDDFTGSTGWTNDGASTCSTGAFVRGNPTLVTNGGVTTQPAGDAGGDGFAAFTATNTSAGVNDVDGGVCIARSPTVSVSEASTLSIDWFHGQRDAGDDANDFFRLEYSTNGGGSFNTLVNRGDTVSNAQWATATAAIPAGSDVVIRVQVSDGAGAGDLVEGGVDSVSICN